MGKIIWTELAVADLKSIHEYIASDSKYHANRFVAEVTNRIGQLETFPSSGRIVPEFKFTSMREIIVGRYRMYIMYLKTRL